MRAPIATLRDTQRPQTRPFRLLFAAHTGQYVTLPPCTCSSCLAALLPILISFGDDAQCFLRSSCHSKYVFTNSAAHRVKVSAEFVQFATNMPVVVPFVNLSPFFDGPVFHLCSLFVRLSLTPPFCWFLDLELLRQNSMLFDTSRPERSSDQRVQVVSDIVVVGKVLLPTRKQT